MQNRINHTGILLATLLGASPVAAQRVLDLPMRTTAGADALARGPIAVFWNPGALGIPARRGEGLLLDVRGPSATGLDGVGLAGVMRLDASTSLGFGFQHVGVADIEQTTTSPLPEDGAVPLDIAENAFSIAIDRSLSKGLSVGAGAHYTRTAAVLDGDNVTSFGAGFLYQATTSFHPALAAGLLFEQAANGWFAAAGAERAVAPDWSVGAEYGASGSERFQGVAHRIAAVGAWREWLRFTAGVAGEPGVGERTWKLATGATVQLSRYQLGVLREDMPNGIGAVHSFRLSVVF